MGGVYLVPCPHFRLASNPKSCSKSGGSEHRRTLSGGTPLHSERSEQHYPEKESSNPTWRSGSWTVGGVERRVDRKEASAVWKRLGWSERPANSHVLRKVHRRLNDANLQVIAMYLNPKPS